LHTGWRRLPATQIGERRAIKMLESEKLVAFGATSDGARAIKFYGDVLGLATRHDDSFAVVFDAGGTELRLQKVERFSPHPFTALGWQVADIGQVVDRLVGAGIQPERYAWMEQDARGIWSAPSGARVAWFKDPDGNLLSVAQYPVG
jgi:predicted enzyme related to lactoylglutathione lyase